MTLDHLRVHAERLNDAKALLARARIACDIAERVYNNASAEYQRDKFLTAVRGHTQHKVLRP